MNCSSKPCQVNMNSKSLMIAVSGEQLQTVCKVYICVFEQQTTANKVRFLVVVF